MTAPSRLAYCTNVHAGSTLEETLANLTRFSVPVREQLGVDQLAIGLWLADSVAQELETNDAARRLRDQLDQLGIRVCTLNGFPQHNFHAPIVKHAVYEPNWATRERFDYTLRLARLALDLIPDDQDDISISTLPIGWRADADNDAAAAQFNALAQELARLEERSSRRVHVDLEPEPGCAIDTALDLCQFFELLDDSSRRHIGVCHDMCHSAVMFESQRDALDAYAANNIALGKVQVSNCPQVNFDSLDEEERLAARAMLEQFVEPRYLHQTSVRNADGHVRFFEDLPDSLAECESRGCWRVHFHVPIFAATLGAIDTTQSQLLDCLAVLGPTPPTLEVETYAWNVLPSGLFADDLAGGIAHELRWLTEQLESQRGVST